MKLTKVFGAVVCLALAFSAQATEAMVNTLRQKFPLAEVSEVSTTNYLVRLTADCGPVVLSGVIGGLTIDLNGHSITGKADVVSLQDGTPDGTALELERDICLALTIKGPGGILGGDGKNITSREKYYSYGYAGGYGIFMDWGFSALPYPNITITIESGVVVRGGRGGDVVYGSGGSGGIGVELWSFYNKVITLYNYGTIEGGDGGSGSPSGGAGGRSLDASPLYNYGTIRSGNGGSGVNPGAPGINGTPVAGAKGEVLVGDYGENPLIHELASQLGATLKTDAPDDHTLTLQSDVGPVWIPPNMGDLEIDLNGHSITGFQAQGDLIAGAAVVVTGAWAYANSPTVLAITGSGNVVGGNGSSGSSGSPGVYVAVEGANGWESISVGSGVTVQGGAGGDNPAGVGGTGGAGVYYRSDPVDAYPLKYYSFISLSNSGTISGGAGGAGATGGGDGGYGVYRRGACLVYETASYNGYPVSCFGNTGTVKGGDGGIGGEGAAKPGLGGAWTDVLGHGDRNAGTGVFGAPGAYDVDSIDNIYTNLVTVERTSTGAEDPRDKVTLGLVGWTVDAADAQGRATAVRTAAGGIAGSRSGMARMTMNVVGTGAVTLGRVVRSPTEEGGKVAALAIYVDGAEVRRLEEASAVVMGGLREENVEVIVSGDGNADHVVEVVYEQVACYGDFESICSIGGITWRSFYQMDDGGTTWLDTAEAAPVVIVDHEQAAPNVTHLAFTPRLKVPGELEYWIRRSAEKDANGRSRICVKLGRTRRECTAATPIDAELRDFGEDIPKGARDLDKGLVWLTVTLPENVVQPVGYWRVYLRPSQMDFAPEHAQRAMGPTSFRVHYLEVGTEAVLAEPRTFTNQKVGALVHIPWYAVDVGRGYTLQNDPDECALLAPDPALNEYVCWYSHPMEATYTVRYMSGDSRSSFYRDIDLPKRVEGLSVGDIYTYELWSDDKWRIGYWNCWDWSDSRELDWIDELNAVFFFYSDGSPR